MVNQLEEKLLLDDQDVGWHEEASDSGPADSDDDHHGDVTKAREADDMRIARLAATIEAPDSPVNANATKSAALQSWHLAGSHVRRYAKVKLTLRALHNGTKKMRAIQVEKEQSWLVAKLFMLIVFLAVVDTETKAIAFHSSAVGLYSVDGKPYKFNYSLTLTLLTFMVKIALGPIEGMLKRREKAARRAQHNLERAEGTRPPKKVKPAITAEGASTKQKSLLDLAMPYVLLASFTFMEMLFAALSSYALTMTPTAIFIVFNSSKMVFVALASKMILGTSLRVEQWASLLLITLALLLATVAEGKGGKKGGSLKVEGPIILFIAQMCNASKLIFQQIAVQSYWPEPMKLVSASALLGVPMTIISMVAASHMTSPGYPHHPLSDPLDALTMCGNNPVLAVAFFGHLFCHVTMDVNNILSLKHISSLTRSLSAPIKLAVMWVIGKMCFFVGHRVYGDDFNADDGMLFVLAEPWRPKSWVMFPALALIGHAMLMFKFKCWFPLQVTKEDGRWHLQLVKAVPTEEEREHKFGLQEVGLDDGFYAGAFNNSKAWKAARKLRRHQAEKAGSQ